MIGKTPLTATERVQRYRDKHKKRFDVDREKMAKRSRDARARLKALEAKVKLEAVAVRKTLRMK